MQKIGEVMHLAGSGRVIIRLSSEVDGGQILCDSSGTRIAKVVEMIGPVGRPFASATPLTNSIKKHVGKNVFAAVDASENKRRLGRKR